MNIRENLNKDYRGRLAAIQKLKEWKVSRADMYLPTHHIENTLKKHQPQLVFLDTQEGIELVATAIAKGNPVVTDYGATYGTAFSLNIRQEVAEIRKEQEPLAIVSLVCSKRDALSWMDTSRMHPEIVASIYNQQECSNLDVIEGIAFIRFPCTDEAKEELGSYYVNQDREVQVFMVDNDPLMDYLSQQFDIHYIAVRSSNITGRPEEPFKNGAEVYASEIGAPIIAVRSKAALQAQLDDEAVVSTSEIAENLRRQRVGSQPILVFKTENGEPVVELARAGNTTPETMHRLLRDFLRDTIQFNYHEEKIAGHKRKMFDVNPAVTDPAEIKKIILKASLIT
ncbi:MAG: hypothetical protein QG639_396 [Patescibacteria group bacterium]|jgi:hypothetical protein|nr:hypothetical protein [Patescibacteria group bacterium]